MRCDAAESRSRARSGASDGQGSGQCLSCTMKRRPNSNAQPHGLPTQLGSVSRSIAKSALGALPAAEARFALLHEGLGGLAVVLGERGVDMVGNFEVHALA